MTFDFEIDFSDYSELSTCKTVDKFTLWGGVMNLSDFKIPREGESIRFLSGKGDFSSCCVLMRIAELTNISKAVITTLRAGKKEVDALEALEIPSVHIVCGTIMKETDNKYNQMKYLQDKAEINGWTVTCVENHSKLILLDTDDGKICVETSSNFNENPKIEQFCVINSQDVYEWYIEILHKFDII